MNNIKKILVIGLFISIALVGCSKLNRENYDKIKVGMEYREVVSIIGKPDKCDDTIGVKNCIWGNENKNITINFVAGRVVVPSMKGL
jgi:hypothetical protein